MKKSIDVRKLRDGLGIDRQDFADLLGVDNATVWRWETLNSKPKGLALRALEKLQAKSAAK